MQVQRIGYRVKGLYRVGRLEMKWGMIAPDTETRLKILCFWEEHGLKATMAAFEVSRRTLFEWKRRLKAEGPRGLPPVPRVPNGCEDPSGRVCWSPRSVGYGPSTRTSGAKNLRCCSPRGDRHRGSLFPANVRWGASSRGHRTGCVIVLCVSTPKAARSVGTERARPVNPRASGQRGRVSAWVSIPSSASVTGCGATSSQHRTSAPVLASPWRYRATGVSGQPRPLISHKRCCRCVSSTHFMIMARSSRDSSPKPPRRPESPNGIPSREHPK